MASNYFLKVNWQVVLVLGLNAHWPFQKFCLQLLLTLTTIVITFLGRNEEIHSQSTGLYISLPVACKPQYLKVQHFAIIYHSSQFTLFSCLNLPHSFIPPHTSSCFLYLPSYFTSPIVTRSFLYYLSTLPQDDTPPSHLYQWSWPFQVQASRVIVWCWGGLYRSLTFDTPTSISSLAYLFQGKG